MTVCFLRDVSALLAISTVRQNNFKRHLQAEREMIKYCLPFGHINYLRYLIYQFVSLRTKRMEHRCGRYKKPLKQYQ